MREQFVEAVDSYARKWREGAFGIVVIAVTIAGSAAMAAVLWFVIGLAIEVAAKIAGRSEPPETLWVFVALFIAIFPHTMSAMPAPSSLLSKSDEPPEHVAKARSPTAAVGSLIPMAAGIVIAAWYITRTLWPPS